MSEIVLIEDSKEKTFKVLYSLKINKKTYIIYTDDIMDEDGFTKNYVGIYQNTNGKEKLLPVESIEEIENVNEILERLSREE